MTTQQKIVKVGLQGLLAAVAASLCCITPVLAFLGGASGLASSFSWIEPYRPYLIGLTIAVFAFAWYQKLNRKNKLTATVKQTIKNHFGNQNHF
jgi:mercuric ion transport protein